MPKQRRKPALKQQQQNQAEKEQDALMPNSEAGRMILGQQILQALDSATVFTSNALAAKLDLLGEIEVDSDAPAQLSDNQKATYEQYLQEQSFQLCFSECAGHLSKALLSLETLPNQDSVQTQIPHMPEGGPVPEAA